MTKNMYHYTECGLDYVYLTSGFKVHKTTYGDAVEVENASKLDRVIALMVVHRQGRLTGQEVRFLRGLMDMTQAELGEYLGKDAQSIARWEKGKNEIPTAEDRALRQIYLEVTGHKQSFMKTSKHTAGLTTRLDQVRFKKVPHRIWAEASL